MSSLKIKRDCFGFNGEKGTCNALNKLYCMCEEKCGFYKTKEEFEASCKKYDRKVREAENEQTK